MSIYTLSSSVVEAWGDRYKMEITVSNDGTTRLDNIQFDMALDGLIDKLWSADWTTDGQGSYRVSADVGLQPGDTYKNRRHC
ncbi:cellulose binding domain-containing protein [Roseibium salinum]|nr:cellulose binding domain-containing protein [Roseibium salinum]